MLLFNRRQTLQLNVLFLRNNIWSIYKNFSSYRFSSLEENSSGLSEGLWRRARSSGAFTPMEKRAFGIADDM